MIIFSWTAENIAHVGTHSVKPDEAEYVVRHARKPYPEYVGEKKWKVRGKTSVGRRLQVIFTYIEDDRLDIDTLDLHELIAFSDGDAQVVYVVHAMELTDDMKRQTRKRDQS